MKANGNGLQNTLRTLGFASVFENLQEDVKLILENGIVEEKGTQERVIKMDLKGY